MPYVRLRFDPECVPGNKYVCLTRTFFVDIYSMFERQKQLHIKSLLPLFGRPYVKFNGADIDAWVDFDELTRDRHLLTSDSSENSSLSVTCVRLRYLPP